MVFLVEDNNTKDIYLYIENFQMERFELCIQVARPY
jgi:acyl-CoA synthetase (NDP forming)